MRAGICMPRITYKLLLNRYRIYTKEIVPSFLILIIWRAEDCHIITNEVVLFSYQIKHPCHAI